MAKKTAAQHNDIPSKMNDGSFKFYSIDNVNFDDFLVSTKDKLINAKLDELIIERKAWEAKEYFKSNERLYSILTNCYLVFLSMNGTTGDSIVARKSFDRVIKVRGHNFKDTMHLMVQVIRVVFESDSRRTSKYATALRIAAEQNVPANDLKDFLYSNGGIEEVSRLKKKEGLPRHKKGKAVLFCDPITTIQDKKILEKLNFTDYEDAVLFLATFDKQSGSFDVLSVIQNKTAIKAAFTSLASKVGEPELSALQADLAEEKAKVDAEKKKLASKSNQHKIVRG